MQTGGKDRICVVIAGRQAVGFCEQKVNANNPRRSRDFN
jgi:hypothetical protein